MNVANRALTIYVAPNNYHACPPPSHTDVALLKKRNNQLLHLTLPLPPHLHTVIVPSCFEGVFGAILLIFLCVDVVDMLMR
jgi:hypothetical protein